MLADISWLHQQCDVSHWLESGGLSQAYTTLETFDKETGCFDFQIEWESLIKHSFHPTRSFPKSHLDLCQPKFSDFSSTCSNIQYFLYLFRYSISLGEIRVKWSHTQGENITFKLLCIFWNTHTQNGIICIIFIARKKY